MWGLILGLACTDGLSCQAVVHVSTPYTGSAAQMTAVGFHDELFLATSRYCVWAGIPPAPRRALR